MQEANNQLIRLELDEPRASIREEALDARKDARFKRLAAAVILQAVNDLSKHGSGLQRQAARDWFAGKRTEGLSFELCCKLLDRNTEDTRRKLEAHFGQAFSIDRLARQMQRERESSPVSH